MTWSRTRGWSGSRGIRMAAACCSRWTATSTSPRPARRLSASPRHDRANRRCCIRQTAGGSRSCAAETSGSWTPAQDGGWRHGGSRRLAAEGVVVERFLWSPDGAGLAVIERDVRKVPDAQDPRLPARRDRRRRGAAAAARRGGAQPASGPVQVAARPTAALGRSRRHPAGLHPRLGLVARQTSLLWTPATCTPRTVVSSSPTRPTGTVRDGSASSNPENVTAEWTVAMGAGRRRHLFHVGPGRGLSHLSPGVRRAEPGANHPRRRGRCARFDVPPAAGAIFFVGNEGRPEERHLFASGRRAARSPVRPRRPGRHAPVVSPDGRFAADYFLERRDPFDLFLTRLDAAAATPANERQVTHSPLPAFGTIRGSEPDT